MSAFELSAEDVEALNMAHAEWIAWHERGTWESYIRPAVEAITQAAINAALNDAAEVTEAAREVVSACDELRPARDAVDRLRAALAARTH